MPKSVFSNVDEKAREAAAKPLGELTFADMDVIGCPYHAYKRLRQEAPVFKDPVTGFYMITRYEDISRALKDTATFSSDGMFPREEYTRPVQYGGLPVTDTMISSDPPKHKYYRGPITKVFSQARVNKMEAYIQAMADGLIDAFIDKGECDFVGQLAMPLPLNVIADQLGVPRSDLPSFKRWSDAVAIQVSGFVTEDDLVWAAKETVDFQNYFLKVIAEKKKNPTDDIITDLCAMIMDDDKPMSDVDLLSTIGVILAAGNETTTNGMSLAMLALLENPDQMQALYADPALIEAFVEESLRFDGPVQGLMRRATCDTEVAGVKIPAGSFVSMRFTSGNRDDAKYAEPDKFDIKREDGPVHLAFGQGTHFCLGALLARKEMLVAFRSMIKRTRNIRFRDENPDFHFERNITLRGLKHLHIAFDKA